MKDIQFLTLLLIISGGIIICIPAYHTRKLIGIIRSVKYKSQWKFLLGLMLFLCLGYFSIAALIQTLDEAYVYTFIGLIFFFGAVFVYLTVWTGKNTIEDLISTSYSKEYVENIIKSMADTLIVINADKDKTIRTVNNATVNLLGYNAEELLGNSVKKVVDSTLSDKALEGTMNSAGSLLDIETIYKTKSGEEIPVRFSATTLQNLQGEIEGVIYVAQDIRERKEAERKIKQYVEQLKELNASKDRFFSIIAHDLRSPFSGVLGYSEILASDSAEMDKDELKMFSTNLYKQTKSIYELLENLLDWSRIQTGRMQYNPSNIGLNECINNLTVVYESLASKKNIDLSFANGSDYSVFADKNMLHTILRNLTSNAIKFSNEGGKVVIDINDVNDDFVEVSVKDSGIGIPKEVQESLLSTDSHHSTKGTNNEEGTGLGLILCNELVKKNGGELRLESEFGKGTTFRFTIPKSN